MRPSMIVISSRWLSIGRDDDHLEPGRQALGMSQREQCLKDLRRLLASEGLAKVPVMAVSAATGEGIEGSE